MLLSHSIADSMPPEQVPAFQAAARQDSDSLRNRFLSLGPTRKDAEAPFLLLAMAAQGDDIEALLLDLSPGRRMQVQRVLGSAQANVDRAKG